MQRKCNQIIDIFFLALKIHGPSNSIGKIFSQPRCLGLTFSPWVLLTLKNFRLHGSLKDHEPWELSHERQLSIFGKSWIWSGKKIALTN